MPDPSASIETLQTLRAFVLRSARLASLADDDELFGKGGINSMFAMQLVLFIEKQFGVKVEDDDLDMANFRTLAALTRFVARKTAPAAASGHPGAEVPAACK